MHARSGAWRCCDGKERAARVQGELLLAGSLLSSVELQISIDLYCWEAPKRSQAAITELLLFRKSTGVILRDALPALQRLCAYGPFEDCQGRMFVKQRALQCANLCEAAEQAAPADTCC